MHNLDLHTKATSDAAHSRSMAMGGAVNGRGKKRRHWMGTEDGKIARRRVVGFLVLLYV
jgi:hypothetical protein